MQTLEITGIIYGTNTYLEDECHAQAGDNTNPCWLLQPGEAWRHVYNCIRVDNNVSDSGCRLVVASTNTLCSQWQKDTVHKATCLFLHAAELDPRSDASDESKL